MSAIQRHRQSRPPEPAEHGPIVVGVVPGQPAIVIERAAGFAAALAVEMLCVWADPASYIRHGNNGSEWAVSVDPDVGDPAAQDVATPLTEELAIRLRPFDVEWSFRAAAGEPARELSRLAESIHASMVVVGTREPGIGARLEEILTGSVAVHLTHHQSCPVMVIPLHPKPFSEARR